MKALLLAAGQGTRLLPLTESRPKPMLPIGERPVLEHLVHLLRDHGCTDIAINLHYLPQTIIRHFGDGERFGVRIVYSYEPTLLGSAGAVRPLSWFFDQTFLVVYGDLFGTPDLGAMMAHHRSRQADVTIAVHEVDDPWNKGVIELDSAGWVRRFVEKPPRGSEFGNLVNAGIYVVEPTVVRRIPVEGASDFGHDVFPRLLGEGYRLAGFRVAGDLVDIGTVEMYRSISERFAKDDRPT
jgi:NDP-sugar pyrophosphorylase family protein